MGKLIFESSFGTVKRRTWSSLRDNQWRDFALVLMEMDQELEAKGVKVDRGKVIMETDTEMSDVSILVSELMSRTLVMEDETDMQVAIFVSAINFFEMLIYFLPWYDRINPTFINLCKVLDISYRYMEEQVASVERNLNLDTAIEMLPYFEERLGIRTIPDISYKQRRRQVQAVLNLMHKQTDEETIKELCSAFSNNNAGAEIYKTENPYVFEIRFVANGLPNNLEEFERMLRINMPADLDWKFTYTQKTREEVSGRVRWRDLEPISWSEFNEYKG